jgi:hypothetical protein
MIQERINYLIINTGDHYIGLNVRLHGCKVARLPRLAQIAKYADPAALSC